jgi:hypothetical protein
VASREGYRLRGLNFNVAGKRSLFLRTRGPRGVQSAGAEHPQKDFLSFLGLGSMEKPLHQLFHLFINIHQKSASPARALDRRQASAER